MYSNIFTSSLFQLTYGGASPLLSDRTRFPRLFRLVAPDSRYNLARIALARHFNWKKIATINVALDYFSAVWYVLTKVCETPQIEGWAQDCSNSNILLKSLFRGNFDPFVNNANLGAIAHISYLKLSLSLKKSKDIYNSLPANLCLRSVKRVSIIFKCY